MTPLAPCQFLALVLSVFMPNKRASIDAKTVGVICKLIGQIPAFHVHEEFVASRFGQEVPEVALRAMTHNAAIDSTLVNLRAFNEFFKPGGRSDDIRISDFAGCSLAPFLTPTEEEEINKHLAHLTFKRAEIEAKPWELDHLVTLGLKHGIELLTFIEATVSLPDAGRAEVLGVREGAARILRLLAIRFGAGREPG